MGTSASHRITLDAGPLPRTSELAELPFAIMLARVRAHSITGTMEVGNAKSILFQRGTPVDVLSEWPDEITEIYMLREGLVREQDVPMAREHATSRGEGFAEALMDLGLLRPSELYDHATRSAHQRLVSCFGLTRGTVRFEETFEISAGQRSLPLDVVKAMGEGLERFYDRARLDRELPIGPSSVVLPLELEGRPWLGERLGTIDARIRRVAEERPTLAQLEQGMQLAGDELRRRLYALYCLGLVGFEVAPENARDEAKPAPPTLPHITRRSPAPWLLDRSRPRPSVAGQPTEWASSTVRAEERLAPTPAGISTGERPGSSPPLRTPPPAPRTARSSPSAVRARVVTPPARPSARTRDAAREVARLLEEAELARVSGDPMRAIVLLREAQELQPDSAVVLGDLALTLFQQDPRRFGREANVLARQARQTDPALAKPYVVLGMLLEQVLESSRAAQLYRYALTRDPDCVEAQECLDRLGDQNARSA